MKLNHTVCFGLYWLDMSYPHRVQIITWERWILQGRKAVTEFKEGVSSWELIVAAAPLSNLAINISVIQCFFTLNFSWQFNIWISMHFKQCGTNVFVWEYIYSNPQDFTKTLKIWSQKVSQRYLQKVEGGCSKFICYANKQTTQNQINPETKTAFRVYFYFSSQFWLFFL